VKVVPLRQANIPIQDMPAWACRLTGHEPSADPDAEVRVSVRGALRAVSIRVPDCTDAEPEVFAASVRDAYRRLFRELGGWPPIRFWNFVPDVGRPLGNGLDRYMCFNEARHAALLEIMGSQSALEKSLRAATGLGHDGSDLQIHCLASHHPSRGVENPRQIPAWSYSAAYGPAPPSFARATVARLGESGGNTLLIGGTASIRGEDSVHVDDTTAQLEETLQNLATLVESAAGRNSGDPLARLVNLRIYHHPQVAPETLRSLLRSRLAESVDLEFRLATLCRPELLVEIEGCANLGD